MTDDEVLELLPAVEEFIDAVIDRNTDAVEACIRFTPASTLAVILAELLNTTRCDLRYSNHVLDMTEDIRPAGVSRKMMWQIATREAA